MDSERDRSRRRDVLKRVAVGGMAFMAGCAGESDDEGTTTGDGGTTAGDGGDSGDSSDGTTSPVESRTIKSGILHGVSGPLSESGAFIRDSAQACAEYIDETSDTFSIETQFADTALDPNKAISEAESMINQGAPMIHGAIASSVSMQVANNATIPNDVVLCSPASTTPKITTLDDNDTVYRTALNDAIQGQVMAKVGEERLDGQTAAIMAQNDAYGQGLGETFANAWEERGGTVQEKVFFQPEQSSYSSQLSKALSDQPDILQVVTFSKSAVQLFRDYYSSYSADFTDVLVSSGLREERLPEDVGNPMNNVQGVAPVSKGPSFDVFKKQFEQRVGEGVNQAFVPQSWDAMAILALANAAAGENDGSAVSDQMRKVANGPGTEVTVGDLADGLEMAAQGEEINYQGASGQITYNENGDISAGVFELWQFQGGNIETIDEIEFSSD